MFYFLLNYLFPGWWSLFQQADPYNGNQMYDTGNFTWELSFKSTSYNEFLICILLTWIIIRQCISVAGISALQNFSIMGLQRVYILISHRLSGDMLVSESLTLLTFTWGTRYLSLNLELSLLADVIVHRLLAASLGICKLPTVFRDRPQLTCIADSKQHNSFLLGFTVKIVWMFRQSSYAFWTSI